jgi:hypothetical protein
MDTSTTVTDQDEDLYLMANVHPKRSGLPFSVYISEKGRHDVRVKVAAGPKALPFVAAVSVRDDVRVLDGALSNADLELMRRWIDLNRDVIVGYWERTIEDTADALAALKPLPKD